jgi:hypothetical protein
LGQQAGYFVSCSMVSAVAVHISAPGFDATDDLAAIAAAAAAAATTVILLLWALGGTLVNLVVRRR